jgi:hypothetical protein
MQHPIIPASSIQLADYDKPILSMAQRLEK